jgi:hypothetical protein
LFGQRGPGADYQSAVMALQARGELRHFAENGRLYRTTGLPVQAVSTGASHLLVPVQSRAAITQAIPDVPELARILHDVSAQGCYLFSLDLIHPAATAHARFFNPGVGLFEDSATGSAAGPLACQLVARGIARENSEIAIEQGHEMGRPSSLAGPCAWRFRTLVRALRNGRRRDAVRLIGFHRLRCRALECDFVRPSDGPSAERGTDQHGN